MESKQALKALLSISREKNFDVLENYLQKSDPIAINLSPLPLVEYLSSVVVSQQLSTKAAKTIWDRVHPIVKCSKNYPNLEAELQSAGLSKSKANYVVGLIGNSDLSHLQRSDLINLSNSEFNNLLISIKGIGPWSVHMLSLIHI